MLQGYFSDGDQDRAVGVGGTAFGRAELPTSDDPRIVHPGASVRLADFPLALEATAACHHDLTRRQRDGEAPSSREARTQIEAPH